VATTESDLKALEEDVLDRLSEETGGIEAAIEEAAGAPEDAAPEHPIVRVAIAIADADIDTARMTGGEGTGTGQGV
jgi:hypothetical protein